MKISRKIVFLSASLNIFILVAFLISFTRPVKAEPDQWRYQSYACYYTPPEGGFAIGTRWVCEEVGNWWICYEGWPRIPCGPSIPPPN